jgi:hypothetical protein
MPKKKYWTTTKAIEEAAALGIEVSLPTLIKWCELYHLGFQLGGKGGKWYVFPNRFNKYINSGLIDYAEIQESEAAGK